MIEFEQPPEPTQLVALRIPLSLLAEIDALVPEGERGRSAKRSAVIRSLLRAALALKSAKAARKAK